MDLPKGSQHREMVCVMPATTFKGSSKTTLNPTSLVRDGKGDITGVDKTPVPVDPQQVLVRIVIKKDHERDEKCSALRQSSAPRVSGYIFHLSRS
jgi:hypothetical protein